MEPGKAQWYPFRILGASELARPMLPGVRFVFLIVWRHAVEGVPELLGVTGATLIGLRCSILDFFGRQHEPLSRAGSGSLDQRQIRERVGIGDDSLERVPSQADQSRLEIIEPVVGDVGRPVAAGRSVTGRRR